MRSAASAQSIDPSAQEHCVSRQIKLRPLLNLILFGPSPWTRSFAALRIEEASRRICKLAEDLLEQSGHAEKERTKRYVLIKSLRSVQERLVCNMPFHDNSLQEALY